ncbi:DoxX family protein [Arthrobacter castelli]|uniref:DoxX family protein n=1 Tax=Arthrobacter castelli TaxID=271431 RepID=UPI0004271029|nr:MauE/DoxX family redox-associated membrane protein [Arthrobacter castelli]
MNTSPGRSPSNSTVALAGLLTVSAVNHFATPHFYYAVVPPSITTGSMTRKNWVHTSGLIEFAGAAGLLLPQTRRAAAICTTVMFAGFTAGHITALQRACGPKGSRRARVVHSLRLPLQVPLVAWAWKARNG